MQCLTRTEVGIPPWDWVISKNGCTNRSTVTEDHSSFTQGSNPVFGPLGWVITMLWIEVNNRTVGSRCSWKWGVQIQPWLCGHCKRKQAHIYLTSWHCHYKGWLFEPHYSSIVTAKTADSNTEVEVTVRKWKFESYFRTPKMLIHFLRSY